MTFFHFYKFIIIINVNWMLTMEALLLLCGLYSTEKTVRIERTKPVYFTRQDGI